ncbi:PaaI family thioesterase [Novosphingobium sp. P6W]|uniref:PaaI family thioesterase n=1 Tax=Novosphingobium sp. P6W TaxID=1609758 RepID=UPI001964DB47
MNASPSRNVFNPIGSVHGGYAATLLDSACGCAVHSSLPVGQGYTTLELKVAYQRALDEAAGPFVWKASWCRWGVVSAFPRRSWSMQEANYARRLPLPC